MKKTFVLGMLSIGALAIVACSSTTESTPTDDAGTRTPIKDASSDVKDSSTTTGNQTTDDAGDDPAPTCELAITVKDTECQTCLEDSCCAEVNGCFGDKACAALFSTIQKCFTAGDGGAGDDECAQKALEAAPEATSTLFLDFNKCVGGCTACGG